MLDKVLRSKAKWILKVSPDSAGDAHGTIYPGLFRIARPAGRQYGARSDRDFVYRLAGDAVRSTDLLRHSVVCQDQRTAAANGVGFGPWGAEPRHVQPRLPHARPAGFRKGLPPVYASLCTDAAGRCCARWQGAQAGLRTRQKSHAADHGDGLERADPHGAGQCFGGRQQRGGGCPAAYRSFDLEGCVVCRRAALPPRHGSRDCRARRRLRAAVKDNQPALLRDAEPPSRRQPARAPPSA